ncbi:hypothetical protein ANCDUO_11658 [Ancylostoma duodenale]|uniref:Uncharacterized protein n=1 Tax=Ancylostoma duodenale TaxID=51022 RepID=A0A0C2CN60_9BILA|nr:hypothetical protein ANCDUO_11658 [Ancylostoma duodenale]
MAQILQSDPLYLVTAYNQALQLAGHELCDWLDSRLQEIPLRCGALATAWCSVEILRRFIIMETVASANPSLLQNTEEVIDFASGADGGMSDTSALIGFVAGDTPGCSYG